MRLVAPHNLPSPASHCTITTVMRISSIGLFFLLTLLCLLLEDTSAFPLMSWARVADRRSPGWLRPWRWLFSRKGEDDEQVEDTDRVKNDQTAAADQSSQMGQQFPLTLEQFGPGTFMNIGEDLVYVPYSSMKNLNNNPEWVW